jgi:hypothetical protein
MGWRLPRRGFLGALLIPIHDGLVKDLALDWSAKELFVAREDEFLVMKMDGSPVRSARLQESPTRLHLRRDSLMVSYSGSATVETRDALRLSPIDSIRWADPIRRLEGSYRPAVILADGTVWGSFRGGDGLEGTIPRYVFDEGGTPVGTVGEVRRRKGWLDLRDPNGRVPYLGRLLHPADFASFVAVSPSGRWVGLLDQDLDRRDVVVSIRTFDSARGRHSEAAFAKPGEILEGERRTAVVRRLTRSVSDHRREVDFGRLLEYALREVGVLPFATRLEISDEGVAWVGRDVGVDGSRRWTVVRGRQEMADVLLPKAVRALWVSNDIVVGTVGLPGQGYEIQCYRRTG